MSNNHAVNTECYGTLQRVPVQNPFTTIDKLKGIISDRLHIDYSFNLTYQGAELCGKDALHDLGLDPNHPIRVRRCSTDHPHISDPITDESYISDSITDIFLSYEQTQRDTVRKLRREVEDRNYPCWLDVEQIPGNTDHFSSAIERGIQNSTIFVACITNRYARSSKCRQELNYAKQHRRRIVLLLMEDLHWPPPQIAAAVSGLSYIEFYHTTASASLTPWPAEKFDEFLTRLADFAPHL